MNKNREICGGDVVVGVLWRIGIKKKNRDEYFLQSEYEMGLVLGQVGNERPKQSVRPREPVPRVDTDVIHGERFMHETSVVC